MYLSKSEKSKKIGELREGQADKGKRGEEVGA
jgi:hypothetical protein